MGERSLIAAIEAALKLPEGSRVVRWIGDDCAVVRAGGDQGFDPEKYEAPPQPSPGDGGGGNNGGGNGGGTQAPPG